MAPDGVRRGRKLLFMASRCFLLPLVGLPLSAGVYTQPDLPPVDPADDPVDFSRDVRPILSEHCFQCHGPDPNTREAELRLDTPEGAFAALSGGGHAIVPGELDESELIYRIDPEFEFDQMPPDSFGKPLDRGQVDVLKRWVESGAEWGKHWSFAPVRKPTPPRDDLAPIDAFVAERLAAEGLEMQQAAPPLALLRRVTLDLTGLQPTPEEQRAFEAAVRSEGLERAYTSAVDRLLASPRYGVHMARTWLDAARYGDTHGLHLDNVRSMWPYRDWVVNALNENKPFDEFTIEQLAGDLLPDATLEQKIASGFNRCNPTSAEGGMIAEEYLSIYAKDRADTTATIWLGLTLACAQCHDHKFDPISQRDYYSMYAFFNSLAEEASDRNIENPVPFLRTPSEEEAAELAAMRAHAKELAEELALPRPDLDAREKAWIEAAARDARRFWNVLIPEAVSIEPAGNHVTIDRSTGVVSLSGDAPDKSTYTIDAWAAPGPVAGLRIDALVPEGQAIPGRAHNENFVLTGVEVFARPAGSAVEFAPVPLGAAAATFNQANYDVSGVLDPKSEGGVAGLGKDGDRSVVVTFAEPLTFEAGVDLRVRLLFQSPFAKHDLARFRIALGRSAGVEPAVLLALQMSGGDDGNDELDEALRLAFRRAEAPDWSKTYVEHAALVKKADAFEAALPTTMVSAAREERRPAFIQMRGAYDSHGDEVLPAAPAALPQLPEDAPANRLGLARWLVSGENPLVSRVWVNRAWQHFFGRGLVATPDDFGAQGAWPSHPELLDWLAAEFEDSGWNVKGAHRQIVLSLAYRQSSNVTEELLEKDPGNALVSRGPRYRLDGEVLRDQALFAAGLLDESMGGPGVRPYQPDGVWFAVGYSRSNTVRYEQGPEDHLHRRSLYTFWKRTAPPPNLTTFDAPMRDACVVRRERTNTPLQALVTLNDPTYVEAARFVAERALTAAGDAPIEELFRIVAARPPFPREVEAALELAHTLEAEYGDDEEAAKALLDVGDVAPRTKIDPAKHAAWTLVASAVMNLDDVLTKN